MSDFVAPNTIRKTLCSEIELLERIFELAIHIF